MVSELASEVEAVSPGDFADFVLMSKDKPCWLFKDDSGTKVQQAVHCQRLAVAETPAGYLTAVSCKSHVYLYDTNNLITSLNSNLESPILLTQEYDTKSEILSLAFSSRGEYLFVTQTDGLEIYKVIKRGKPISKPFPLPEKVNVAALYPNPHHDSIVAFQIKQTGGFMVYKIKQSGAKLSFESLADFDNVQAISWTPDGSNLFLGAPDGRVTCAELKFNSTTVHSIQVHDQFSIKRGLTFSMPTDEEAISGCKFNNIVAIDAGRCAIIHTLDKFDDYPDSLQHSIMYYVETDGKKEANFRPVQAGGLFSGSDDIDFPINIHSAIVHKSRPDTMTTVVFSSVVGSDFAALVDLESGDPASQETASGQRKERRPIIKALSMSDSVAIPAMDHSDSYDKNEGPIGVAFAYYRFTSRPQPVLFALDPLGNLKAWRVDYKEFQSDSSDEDENEPESDGDVMPSSIVELDPQEGSSGSEGQTTSPIVIPTKPTSDAKPRVWNSGPLPNVTAMAGVKLEHPAPKTSFKPADLDPVNRSGSSSFAGLKISSSSTPQSQSRQAAAPPFGAQAPGMSLGTAKLADSAASVFGRNMLPGGPLGATFASGFGKASDEKTSAFGIFAANVPAGQSSFLPQRTAAGTPAVKSAFGFEMGPGDGAKGGQAAGSGFGGMFKQAATNPFGRASASSGGTPSVGASFGASGAVSGFGVPSAPSGFGTPSGGNGSFGIPTKGSSETPLPPIPTARAGVPQKTTVLGSTGGAGTFGIQAKSLSTGFGGPAQKDTTIFGAAQTRDVTYFGSLDKASQPDGIINEGRPSAPVIVNQDTSGSFSDYEQISHDDMVQSIGDSFDNSSPAQSARVSSTPRGPPRPPSSHVDGGSEREVDGPKTPSPTRKGWVPPKGRKGKVDRSKLGSLISRIPERDSSQMVVDDSVEKRNFVLTHKHEPTFKLGEFVSHTEEPTSKSILPAAETNSTRICIMIEELVRDINAMLVALGLNMVTLSQWDEAQKLVEPRAAKDAFAVARDFEEDARQMNGGKQVRNGWRLGDMPVLNEVADNLLTTLERLTPMKADMQSVEVSEVHKELQRISNTTYAIRDAVHALRDGQPLDQAFSVASQRNLSAHQEDVSCRLADQVTTFFSSLAKAEAAVATARAHLATAGARAPPTVQAVETTVRKMQSLCNQKRGELDLLADRLEKAKIAAAGPRSPRSPSMFRMSTGFRPSASVGAGRAGRQSIGPGQPEPDVLTGEDGFYGLGDGLSSMPTAPGNVMGPRTSIRPGMFRSSIVSMGSAAGGPTGSSFGTSRLVDGAVLEDNAEGAREMLEKRKLVMHSLARMLAEFEEAE